MGRNSLTIHAIVDDALSPAFPLGVELALLDPELRRDVGIRTPHLLDEPLGVLRGESC